MFANLPKDISSSPNRFFIHMEYSKNNWPKKAARSQITVAYSRPKNIKDLLSKAKLHQAEGKDVSVYYSGGLPSKQVHSPSFFIFLELAKNLCYFFGKPQI